VRIGVSSAVEDMRRLVPNRWFLIKDRTQGCGKELTKDLMAAGPVSRILSAT